MAASPWPVWRRADAPFCVPARPALDQASLVRLREHDEAHDGAYEESLRAYHDCQCSIPAASSRLQLHPSTLRYRLTKLTDLFGIDRDDSHIRLTLSPQLWCCL